MLKFIDEMVGMGKEPPNFMRLDRSGENVAMQDMVKCKCPGIVFEFTLSNTPQQNEKVERGMATIWNRVRATFDAAGIKGELRGKLWGEAIMMSMEWWNVTVKDEEKGCPHVRWWNDCLNWTSLASHYQSPALLPGGMVGHDW